MDKKYQIFVSSTYKDLIEERQEVFKTLIDMEHIPIGMESFPAINMEQFEYIKQMIDECDYYILIIAGRYGSCADDGISYTEKEYDYALSKNIPILTFKHENYQNLPHNKVEETDIGKQKLSKFIAKASNSKLIQFYNNSDQLTGHIAKSLPRTIKKFPAIGWVRADQIADRESLQENIALRKENDDLKKKLAEYENANAKIDNLAGLDDVYELSIKKGFEKNDVMGGFYYEYENDIINLSWKKIFSFIAQRVRSGIRLNDVKVDLENMLTAENKQKIQKIELDNIVIRTIITQFECHNLIFLDTNNSKYFLTKKGEQVMLESLAVTKNQIVTPAEAGVQ